MDFFLPKKNSIYVFIVEKFKLSDAQSYGKFHFISSLHSHTYAHTSTILYHWSDNKQTTTKQKTHFVLINIYIYIYNCEYIYIS